MRRYIAIVSGCLLLLFVLQTTVEACCDCTGCEICVDEQCVDDDSKCDDVCKHCSNGQCLYIGDGESCGNCKECWGSSCVYTCTGCQSCVGWSCEDDDSKCEGDCKVCMSATCYDTCPDKICCTPNNCCHPDYEYCMGNQCRCNNCYDEEYFPPNYIPGCPDCSNAQGGCYSSFVWIQYGFDYFTGSAPEEGELGWCDNPTKEGIVGYHMFCTDYGADVDAIIQVLGGLGDLSTFYSCTMCLGTRSPSHCVSCVRDIILAGLIDLEDFPCLFINECRMCYSVDVACSTPHEETVVDWEALTLMGVPTCAPGINYP